MHFHICICMVFFQLVFNDETWMNVESSWSLEEGTIECRNVGFKYVVRIKYCSFIIQITIVYYPETTSDVGTE